MTDTTYTIPAVNLSHFEAEVAKLNKRARRIGCGEISYQTSHAYNEFEWTHPRRPGTIWNQHSPGEGYEQTGRVREWLNLTVTGDSPKYAGYELISVLEPLKLEDGTSENIVRDLPGKESPKEYRDRIGQCDHCHTQRYRKETFVVRHESGEYKMVGRNCLADFLGHKDPHALAALAEILASLSVLCNQAEEDDLWDRGGHERSSWTLDCLLSWTVSTIKVDGWLGRTKAREMSEAEGRPYMATADTVLQLLSPPPRGSKAHREWQKAVDARTPEEAHKTEAADAIEWVRNLPASELERNDYLYNINLIGRAGFADAKMAGYACSIIVAYRRAVEREVERKQKSARPNEHVGQEGDKLTLALRVEYTREIASDFGCSTLHKMVDSQGRSYSWFSSNGSYDDGEEIYAAATVKRHSEYKGRKETQLTRVRKVDTGKTEAKIAEYEAKPKLTSRQQVKLDELREELRIRTAALQELAAYKG